MVIVITGQDSGYHSMEAPLDDVNNTNVPREKVAAGLAVMRTLREPL